MHQPTFTIPSKADRATFREDFTFCIVGSTPSPCYRAAAEDISPDDPLARSTLLRRDLEADRAGRWLMRVAVEYRLSRAARDA